MGGLLLLHHGDGGEVVGGDGDHAAENLVFLVFNVSGATGTQMEKGKLHSLFFIGRTSEGRRTTRGEPRGPIQGPTWLDSLAAGDPPSGASGTSSLGDF